MHIGRIVDKIAQPHNVLLLQNFGADGGVAEIPFKICLLYTSLANYLGFRLFRCFNRLLLLRKGILRKIPLHTVLRKTFQQFLRHFFGRVCGHDIRYAG